MVGNYVSSREQLRDTIRGQAVAQCDSCKDQQMQIYIEAIYVFFNRHKGVDMNISGEFSHRLLNLDSLRIQTLTGN